MGRLRCGDNLFHRRILLAVGDIVKNRSSENPGVLQHHGIGRPETSPGQFPNVLPVHGHASAVHVIKAHQQVDHRGFPGACRTDNGGQFSGVRLHGKIMDNRPIRFIAEENMIQRHVPFRLCQRPCVLRVLKFLRLVQQSEHPFRCGQGRKQFVDDIRNLVDRSGKLAGIQHKGRNIAQADRTVHIQHRSQQGNQAQADIVDKSNRRPDGCRQGICLVVGVRGLVVDIVVFFVNLIFIGIGLDGLLARKLFLHKAVHRSVGFGPLHKPRLRFFAHMGGKSDGSRHRNQRHQAQHRGNPDHHNQRAHHRHNAGQNRHHVRGHAGADYVHVIGNPADDIPCLVPVKKSNRQPHQLVKHILPHLPAHALGYVHHDHVNQNGDQRRACVNRQHPDSVVGNLFKIDPVHARSCLIDGGSRQRRPPQAQHVADQAQYRHQQDPCLESAEVGQQPPEGAFGVFGPGHDGFSARHAPASPIWVCWISR